MKSRYFLGGFFVFIGIVWTVGIMQFLIINVYDTQLQNPSAWASQVYLPAGAISTLLYLGFLFAWIFYSLNSRFRSSANARATITLWVTLLAMSIASNIITLIVCIQFITVLAPGTQNLLGGGTFVDVPPYELVFPLTIVNAILLFWLPSCFLSQRTLRFVPPLSYELISLSEKR